MTVEELVLALSECAARAVVYVPADAEGRTAIPLGVVVTSDRKGSPVVLLLHEVPVPTRPAGETVQ